LIHPGEKEEEEADDPESEDDPFASAEVGVPQRLVLGFDRNAVVVDRGVGRRGELLEGRELHGAHGARLALAFFEHFPTERAREERHGRRIRDVERHTVRDTGGPAEVPPTSTDHTRAPSGAMEAPRALS
jgi:hypothetical protein